MCLILSTINRNLIRYNLKTIKINFGLFQSNNMGDIINSQTTRLLQRLRDADKRAQLLSAEIKDIRSQIAGLTQSTNNILKAVSTSSKREISPTDFNDETPSKKLKYDFTMENDYVVVYTDGACENNGRSNAKAGIGVWFGDGHHLNISKPVNGRATNNTAEIQAPTEALKLLNSLGYKKAKIFTDSQFTINCITKWMKNWKRNNWKLAKGGPVKNKEDLVRLDEECRKFQDVKWIYVAGHQGNYGNDEADKLAKNGASQSTRK